MPTDKIPQDIAGGIKSSGEIESMITEFGGVGTPPTLGSVTEAAPFQSDARGLSTSASYGMGQGVTSTNDDEDNE
jgi:hypothetical protein